MATRRDNVHTPAFHWDHFAEFVKYERAVGGPDPHMVLVGHMSRNVSWEERVWRAGCYISVYNTPTAEVLWRAWPWPTVRQLSGQGLGGRVLEDWLREHWAGIVTRRERRCVRDPVKLARFLCEYAAWMVPTGRRHFARQGPDAYEAMWTSCQQVYTLGRYVAIKLLEFFGRYCDFPARLSDIRPRGGPSPRETLAMLYPEHATVLLGDDADETLAAVNVIAADARTRLARDYGLDVDFFLLQVLLCDYKQSYNGRQYPGRSHDSELVHYRRVAEHFGGETDMFTARHALFPHEALGEVSGWSGVRKELGLVLRTYGYTWRDTEFSYLASKDDLAHPVPF